MGLSELGHIGESFMINRLAFYVKRIFTLRDSGLFEGFREVDPLGEGVGEV